MRSNKNSASEDEVGLIHRGINKILGHQQRRVLEMIEGEGVDPLAIIDSKTMSAHMKWVAQNEIGYSASESEEQDLFAKQMQDIKNKANAATQRLKVVGDD